ncbi:MAG TPA: helix-turn-helix transcriptional regulator, partial [Casimicrobiaceae bacterium]|nr:helix-turn-helix transcriptional regulator [Casimicrobiaceae bacterium]
PLASRNHIILEHEEAWPALVDAFHDFLAPERAFAHDRTIGGLTYRERELLELIAEGRDNDDIARRLDLRNKTVRNHITRIFAKLGVTTRAQAIVLARDAGMGTGERTAARR